LTLAEARISHCPACGKPVSRTVHLALLSGDEAVYVEKLENPRGA